MLFTRCSPSLSCSFLDSESVFVVKFYVVNIITEAFLQSHPVGVIMEKRFLRTPCTGKGSEAYIVSVGMAELSVCTIGSGCL